jgi:hypothetical protein
LLGSITLLAAKFLKFVVRWHRIDLMLLSGSVYNSFDYNNVNQQTVSERKRKIVSCLVLLPTIPPSIRCL